tara:strand:+ start:44 stop:289 length:246 start_codon:yes stop_codon:yes gene_type:complete
MEKGRTQTYYDNNPDANARRLKQQNRYQNTPKGRALKINANKLRKKLKIPVGSTKDAAHYKGSKTDGRPQAQSKNRASRTK